MDNNPQAFHLSMEVVAYETLKRTGTVLTATAHIITAMLGSQVLSLAWEVAQLGWIAGPTMIFLFSCVSYYTSTLLAACYPSNGDPIGGRSKFTYMDAVQSNLGGLFKLSGPVQYLCLIGMAIGCTTEASESMVAIKRPNCFDESGRDNHCNVSSSIYKIIFGVSGIIFSQIPDFDQIWWLSILAAIMAFTYASIKLGLGIAKVAKTGFTGIPPRISIRTDTGTQKLWTSFGALGNIASAYSCTFVLTEIQDTLKAPKAEYKTKRAILISAVVTTTFYMLLGCIGYAAFGDLTPGNPLTYLDSLTAVDTYEPYWLLNLANVAVVIHPFGAYQVHCQPLFAFIERKAQEHFPENKLITKEIEISGFRPRKLNLFRLIWRSLFVISTILISFISFIGGVVGLLVAFGFWVLTVYFPIKMYITQKKMPMWSVGWVRLQVISVACLVISIAAVVGFVADIVKHPDASY